jgi:threonine dehydrogenase-like Zn-dependent dehydrogenase
VTDYARAVELHAYGEDPKVAEIPIRVPRPGEVLVAMRQATVCGTDAHIAQGRFPGSSSIPLVMGHEGCGEIIAAGDERRFDALGQPVRPGDVVVWDHPWCGRCTACAVDRQPTLCSATTGYGWGPSGDGELNGTFATHLLVAPTSNVLRVPDGIDLAVASSATCALRTVMHAFERLGPIRFSDHVVVLGAGAVGLYAAAAALAAGAFDVVLVGAPADRLAVADGWGLGARLDLATSAPEERVDAIHERTQGRGADVVIECAGPAAAFTEGMAMLRSGGRFLVLGQADTRNPEVDTTAMKVRQITVQTALSATIAHFHQALRFLQRQGDRFRFERLVAGARFPLDEVPAALEAVRAGAELKPVIDVGRIATATAPASWPEVPA